MAINDTLELAVRGTVVGQQHIHTMHFRVRGEGSAPQALIDAWLGAPSVAYRAIFSTAESPVQLLRVTTVCASLPLPAALEQNVVGAGALGTRPLTGTADPPFLACVVAERTALAGRTRQGRFFLGGLRDNDTVNSSIQPGYLTLVENYCNALLAAFPAAPTGSFSCVVHSRKLAAQVPALQCQVSSEPITSFTPNPLVTTMRSRKVGSGL